MARIQINRLGQVPNLATLLNTSYGLLAPRLSACSGI